MGNRIYKSESILHKALFLLDSGDKVKGLDHLQLAAQLARTEGNERVLVLALVALGDFFCGQGQRAEGDKFLDEALELAKDVDKYAFEIELISKIRANGAFT